MKLYKIDHDEAWNISHQQSSGFSHEPKTTPLAEYFRPINFINYLHCNIPKKKYKYSHGQ